MTDLRSSLEQYRAAMRETGRDRDAAIQRAAVAMAEAIEAIMAEEARVAKKEKAAEAAESYTSYFSALADAAEKKKAAGDRSPY